MPPEHRAFVQARATRADKHMAVVAIIEDMPSARDLPGSPDIAVKEIDEGASVGLSSDVVASGVGKVNKLSHLASNTAVPPERFLPVSSHVLPTRTLPYRGTKQEISL